MDTPKRYLEEFLDELARNKNPDPDKVLDRLSTLAAWIEDGHPLPRVMLLSGSYRVLKTAPPPEPSGD